MNMEFSCHGCGHCCEGEGGIVVSSSDLARLIGHLTISAEEFEQSYGVRRGGKLFVRTGEDGNCIFYQAGLGCKVHAAKPNICRAWPFFRGNLIDPESLDLSRHFCPGIPRDLDFQSFVRQGLSYLVAQGLAAGEGQDEARALQVTDLLEQLAAEAKNR